MSLDISRTGNGIVTLTLARPHALNALDSELVTQLYDIFAELRARSADRVVVLTGAGSAFCAGQDVKSYGPAKPADSAGAAALLAFQQYMSRLVISLRQLPQPVIAAVNGVAVGGGLALACGSDIRIASTSARFGTGAIRLGLSGCEMGLSYHLPRLVGMSSAADWMLTGRLVSADEALRVGLVSQVVDGAELLPTAHAVAESIAAHAPMGVRLTKTTMWANIDEGSLERAIEREDATQLITYSTDDAREAQIALREGRPPVFLDR